MARHFAGATLAAFFRSAANIVEDTTSGYFDSAYVSNCIKVTYGNTLTTANFSATGTVWFAFEHRCNGVDNPGYAIVTLFNGATNVFRLYHGWLTGTVQPQYWNGSAWTDTGTAFAYSNNVLRRIVVKVTLNSGFEAYVGNTLIASGSSWTGGQTTVTKGQFACGGGGFGGETFISQVMVADYDIRSSHYLCKLPNANGAYTDGGGTYTDINETVLDEGTAINLPAVGNKKSFTKAAITLSGGMAISGMVINARGMVSGGTVTDGKLGVKSGGSYTAGAGRSFNGAFEPRYYIAEVDPATGVAFTASGFNSAEPAVEAA